jgi:hypothetical protein
MSQSTNHKYKLKRGQQEAVERVNPVLDAGEPLVVFCKDGKTRLKIGDGVTAYKDLDFIGSEQEQEILTYPTLFDFPYPPAVDYINYIYKASDTPNFYRWNQTTFKYDALDEVSVNVTISDIDTLNGGTAAELLR